MSLRNPPAGIAGQLPANAVRHRTPGQVIKDIALFFAAPFVTLAYVSLFPFMAMAMLYQALRHRGDAG